MALPTPAWAALSISTFARFLGLHLGKVLGSSDCDDLNHIASSSAILLQMALRNRVGATKPSRHDPRSPCQKAMARWAPARAMKALSLP